MGPRHDGGLDTAIHRRWNRRLRLCAGPFLLLLMMVNSSSGRAQQGDRVKLSVWAGFDGYCKTGSWLPVRALLSNQGPDLAAELEVQVAGSNGDEAVYAREISLPSTSRKELFLYVYPAGFTSELSLRLMADGQEITRARTPLTCLGGGDVLYGVLAEDLAPLNLLAYLDPPGGNARVAQLELADLPDRGQALGALHTLVIAGVDTARLTLAQQGALEGWVESGGRLVVVGGPGWKETTSGLGDLARQLPIHPIAVRPLGQTGAAGSPAGSGPAQFSLPENTLVATGPLSGGAQVLTSQSGIPLAARRAFGTGEILFLAFDPTLEPVRSWTGLAGSFRFLLDSSARSSASSPGFRDWSQASQAATTLPGLQLPPAGWVIGFLGAYVLAVGPVNFFLLRQLRRRELAWLSIPSLVILFTLVAFLAGKDVRGERPVLNRLAVVQARLGSHQAQVSGLVGIFSPVRGLYQVQVSPGFLVHAIPETGAEDGKVILLQTEAGGTLLPDLRVDVGAVRAFAAEGQQEVPGWTADLTLQVGREGAVLGGMFTVPQDLAFQDAVLLAPGKSQRLGPLSPGEQRELGLALEGDSRAIHDPMVPPIYTPFKSGPIDPRFEDLLGTVDYYRDRKTYRRFTLLSAWFGLEPRAGSLLAPFTLAAWSESSPLEASLAGQAFDSTDTSLYLISLEPKIQLGPGRVSLTPGLFTWSVLDPGSQGEASPYETVVNPGGFSLRFRPLVDPGDRAIAGLALQLKNYGAAGQSNLQAQLWDFTTGEWDELPTLVWGENAIPQPERFVGPGGEIRLRLMNGGSPGPVQLESADFILEVEGSVR